MRRRGKLWLDCSTKNYRPRCDDCCGHVQATVEHRAPGRLTYAICEACLQARLDAIREAGQ